jgi:stage II sporulation protein D
VKDTKKLIGIVLAFFVFLFFSPDNVQAKNIHFKSEPTMSVGILTNVQSVKISAGFNYEVAEISKNYAARKEILIFNKDGVLEVDGITAKSGIVTIVPQKGVSTSSKYITVNSHTYRGEIKIRLNGRTSLTVINTLPLEEYIYGVISKEVPTSWPMEAVKAQAVAARSYSIMKRGKHHNDGFDVCATVDCQVYGGHSNETQRGNQAVDETRGMVLTYNGNIVPTYYHSSSGGYTENSENVWGFSQPYLRAVVDFDEGSPHRKWEKEFTIAEFSERLKNAGKNIGTLQTIELSALTKPPVNSRDRGVSGRVNTARFAGTNGSAVIKGTELRTILELRSTLFEMKLVSGKVIITGSGWGHGVGMSQWGMKGMAEKAPSSNKEYYKEILQHYYRNTSVIKAY